MVTKGGHLKYALIDIRKHGCFGSGEYAHRMGGLAQGLLRNNGSRKPVTALDYYNSTVRSTLPFFTRPKLEVEIQPRSLPIESPENLIPQLIRSSDEPYEYTGQTLLVTGKKALIYNLTPSMRFNGFGPHVLEWSRILRNIDPLEGPEPWPFLRGPNHRNLVADESEELAIWAARRTKTGKIYLTLNTHPPVTWKLDDSSGPFVDIDIQFIAENYTDKKPRRYRLNAKSWADLGLTERS